MKQRALYGWKRDKGDDRDKILPLMAIKIPKSVDLRPYCSPVEDQGEIGSCTGNAVAGALEYLEWVDPAIPDIDLSRLFIYYNERILEGTTEEDSGAEIRDGIKALAKWGICSENTWPYDPYRFTDQPSEEAYLEAKPHTISSYQKITSLRGIKQSLAQGYPVIFGFMVFESFESPKVMQTGKMPMPKDREEILGGHAVLAVGYKDSSKRLIVRNSWGTEWGQNGYFTMPYDFVSDPEFADDFWVIRR